MPRGGARSNSGPPKDPNSARSDRLGVKLTALPTSPYDGPIPDWPLPIGDVPIIGAEGEPIGSARYPTDDAIEVWETLWRMSPQAHAWALPAYRSLLPSLARYAALLARVNAGAGNSSDDANVLRFASDVGLTVPGMRLLGWSIAADELSAKRAEAAPEGAPAITSARGRVQIERA